LIVFALFASHVQAQYENEKDASIPLDKFYIKRNGPGIFRTILSKFHFSLSTGYGRTVFNHDLDGYGIYQAPTGAPVIFNEATPTTGFSNWFNEATPLTLPVAPPGFVALSSVSKLGFRSKSFHIPLKATVHYEYKRYRIGAGYSFEFTKVGGFEPTAFGKDIRSFAPDVSSFFLKKYFLVLGASVYRYNDYLLTVDANIGGYSLGSKFDKGSIKRGVFVNLGATVEREMSEYFRLFVRPSYEIRGYTLNMPEGSPAIKHKFNAFYLNVGVTYRLPELRRCFLKDCRVQINHAHGNREYRSRVHPVYKKQNPHYGENYPNLIKYKGKNKRKLNPY
jgi:hypothetical protein